MHLQYSIEAQQPQVLIGVTKFTIKDLNIKIDHSGGCVECLKEFEDRAVIYCESSRDFRVNIFNDNNFSDYESNKLVIQKNGKFLNVDGASLQEDCFIHVYEI